MSCCNSNCNHDPCGSSFNQALTKAGQYAQYAQTQANKAEDLWLEFNALYLGSFASAPTTDNEGNPLQEGALYFNSISNEMFVWQGGSWIDFDFDEFTPFTATGTTEPRNLVTRMADAVNVKDFGAVGNGVTDDTAAFNNAQSAVGTSGTLIIPKGNYLVSGTVYPVQGNFQWTNKGFTGGINLPRQARAAAQLITVETSNASPEEFALSRGGLSVTAVGKGAQHCDGIYSGITNYSTDGDGNTAIYTSVTTDTVSFWAVGTHAESRHGGGLTSCFNAEAQSYTTAGSFLGAAIVNTTIPGLIHATTGQPTVAHPTATGILIQGGNNTNPMGGWVYGINFALSSMRANGTCINITSDALVRSHIETAVGSASAVADILLSGNSANGIILNGTYSGVALRIRENQSIGWNASGTIKSSFDGVTDWGIYTGSTVRASFDLSVSPSLKLNGTKVVGIKQTGWSAMTGTSNNSTSYATSTITLVQLAERVKAIQDALTTHGLIGA